MKTKFTHKLRIAAFGIALLAAGTVSAQTTSGNIGKKTNTALGTTGGSVRVIDNKGTKKFLQVENGLTSFTDTAPDGGIITTWQLGGTLTSNTTITTTGTEGLTIDGGNFNVNDVDLETGAAATTGTLDTSGFTVLVRDEATGNINKILVTDLIESGQTVFTAAIAGAAPTAAELAFDVTAGTPALSGAQIPLPDYSKVWVYRNGAKLIANVDYTIAGSVVTLVPNATDPNDWTLYTGDVIEVQYVK